VVDFGQEHVQRPYAKAPVAVKVAVDNHRLVGFRIVGNVFDKVILAFEMPVHFMQFDCSFHGVQYSNLLVDEFVQRLAGIFDIIHRFGHCDIIKDTEYTHCNRSKLVQVDGKHVVRFMRIFLADDMRLGHI